MSVAAQEVLAMKMVAGLELNPWRRRSRCAEAQLSQEEWPGAFATGALGSDDAGRGFPCLSGHGNDLCLQACFEQLLTTANWRCHIARRKTSASVV